MGRGERRRSGWDFGKRRKCGYAKKRVGGIVPRCLPRTRYCMFEPVVPHPGSDPGNKSSNPSPRLVRHDRRRTTMICRSWDSVSSRKVSLLMVKHSGLNFGTYGIPFPCTWPAPQQQSINFHSPPSIRTAFHAWVENSPGMDSPGCRVENPNPLPCPLTVIDSKPALSARAVNNPAYPSQTARPVDKVEAGVEGCRRLLKKASTS